MAAHYKDAHSAFFRGGALKAKILDDGSKIVQLPLNYSFANNGLGWFAYRGIDPHVFRTAVGSCYALDLQKTGPRELRFGVRQLGRGPPHHRLASVKVGFGAADGFCFQHPLARALAADERLEDAALCMGTPPAVGRVDPAFLAPVLVCRAGTPPPENPWLLEITLTLVFQVVRDAPP